jgi:hypothetical protein
MKKITLLFGVLTSVLVSQQLKAQDSIFDLKNYKTTNYERSSLDLQFNLNERSSKSNTQNDFQVMQKQAGSNLSANLDINSTFTKTLFAEKKIVEYGSNLSVNENYSNYWVQQIDSLTNSSKQINYNGNYSLSGYYNVDLYYSASNRNYFKLGCKALFGIYHSYQKTESSSNSTNINEAWPQFSSQFSIDLGHGHGRIENVEDAVESMYILSDLSKNGLLSRSYTESDVKTLADKITLIKKERFFDERIYKQKSMKALVSALLNDDLIRSESVEVFNIIADYHYYAGIETRPSGKKLEYYLSPCLQYTMHSYSGSGEKLWKRNTNELISNLGLTVYYNNYKPISIKWQRNFNIIVKVSGSRDIEDELLDSNSYESQKTKWETYASSSYTYGFYPSSRTNFSIGVSANYQYSLELTDSESTKDLYNNIYAGIHVGGYYYLSSKLRLSGNFRLTANKNSSEYTYSENSTSNQKNISINNNLALALTYYIY